MRIFLDEITKRHGDAPCFDAFDGTVGEVVGASAATLATPSSVMELPYGNDRDHGSATTSDNNTALPSQPPLQNATARDVDASITRAARDTARILRAHRLDELLHSIHAWAGATCIERAYWRIHARWQLAEFRRLHLHPERRAFEAAVAPLTPAQGGNPMSDTDTITAALAGLRCRERELELEAVAVRARVEEIRDMIERLEPPRRRVGRPRRVTTESELSAYGEARANPYPSQIMAQSASASNAAAPDAAARRGRHACAEADLPSLDDSAGHDLH